jgi:hypothetical protein
MGRGVPLSGCGVGDEFGGPLADRDDRRPAEIAGASRTSPLARSRSASADRRNDKARSVITVLLIEHGPLP